MKMMLISDQKLGTLTWELPSEIASLIRSLPEESRGKALDLLSKKMEARALTLIDVIGLGPLMHLGISALETADADLRTSLENIKGFGIPPPTENDSRH